MIRSVKGILISLLSGLWLSNIVLASQIPLVDRVQACSKIEQDSSRLQCFDQLASKDAIDKLQVDLFAIEQINRNEPENSTAQKSEISSLTLTIRKLSKSLRGHWIIVTDNAQQWQQKDTIPLTLKVTDKVIIYKGAFGATYLKKERSNKSIKVKRLK